MTPQAKIGSVIGAIVLAIFIAAGVSVLLPSRDSPSTYPDRSEHGQLREDSFSKEAVQAGSGHVPGPTDFSRRDLLLPFAVTDIDTTAGEINPLGVVRFAKDQGEFGHSGIDVPLVQNAPIYAVADGDIVQVKSADDPWDGWGVFQLLEATEPGEGWAFVYEHILLAPGIEVGAQLQAGDLVGYKAAPGGFTAHFQLSALFNDYQYTRGMECWPDHLAPEQQAFREWWETHRNSERLAANWSSNQEEGVYPFRGLLDLSLYPDGPQLCYPPGTDVR